MSFYLVILKNFFLLDVKNISTRGCLYAILLSLLNEETNSRKAQLLFLLFGADENHSKRVWI
jgi:hypothetical protein